MAKGKKSAPMNADMERESGYDGENLYSAEIKKHIGIKARLKTKYLLTNGFIGLALSRAGLVDMLAGMLEEIYPIAIFEFLGHLNSKRLTTMVTCENPEIHNRYYRTINLLEFAEKHLKLQNSGEDVMKAGNEVSIAELRSYTLNADESCTVEEVKKYTRHLRTPFKDL
ncbi:hypothetical protein OROMI_018964 [Orobanche minor]